MVCQERRKPVNNETKSDIYRLSFGNGIPRVAEYDAWRLELKAWNRFERIMALLFSSLFFVFAFSGFSGISQRQNSGVRTRFFCHLFLAAGVLRFQESRRFRDSEKFGKLRYWEGDLLNVWSESARYIVQLFTFPHALKTEPPKQPVEMAVNTILLDFGLQDKSCSGDGKLFM